MKRRFYTMIVTLLFIMVAPMFAYDKYVNFTHYQIDVENGSLDYTIENIYCFKTYDLYYNEKANAISDYMGILRMTAQLYEQSICDVSTWTLENRDNFPADFLTYVDNNSRVVTFNIDGTTFTITEYRAWNEYKILKRELKAYKCEINSSK